MSRLAVRLGGTGQWEDILQDALVLAWRKRASFNPDRGSARGWLLALVMDKASKHRRQRSAGLVLVDVADVGSLEGPGPALDVEVRIELDQAMRCLTGRQRVAVELFYFLGMPVAETAEVMGCSVGTVKSTLSDARGRLRMHLEARNDV
jgi:RNA polymerase sigma-70 factor (ECF subfamily)